MTALKYIVLAIAILMYLLVILFQNKKVWFTSIAAVLVIILGMIFPGRIFSLPEASVIPDNLWAFTHSVFQIINWNVIMIYLGFFILFLISFISF